MTETNKEETESEQLENVGLKKCKRVVEDMGVCWDVYGTEHLDKLLQQSGLEVGYIRKSGDCSAVGESTRSIKRQNLQKIRQLGPFAHSTCQRQSDSCPRSMKLRDRAHQRNAYGGQSIN